MLTICSEPFTVRFKATWANLHGLHPPVWDGPCEDFPQNDAVAKHVRLLGVVLAVNHLLAKKKKKKSRESVSAKRWG